MISRGGIPASNEPPTRLSNGARLVARVGEPPTPRGTRHLRVGVLVQRHVLLGDAAVRGVGSDERLSHVEDRGSAAEAVTQGVVAAAGELLVKALDALGQRVAERVQALVVVARHEQLHSVSRERAHKAQIHRIEVLVLVHDQVLDAKERRRIERSSLHHLDAPLDDLARKNAGVQLASKAVECPEAITLLVRDRRVRRLLARAGLVLARAPERLEVPSDLRAPGDRPDIHRLAKLLVEQVPKLPAIEHPWIDRIRAAKDAPGLERPKRERVKRGHGDSAVVMPLSGARRTNAFLKVACRCACERDGGYRLGGNALSEQPADALLNGERHISSSVGMRRARTRVPGADTRCTRRQPVT